MVATLRSRFRWWHAATLLSAAACIGALAPAGARAAEQGALVGTPTAPVSVTNGHSFTVTGTVQDVDSASVAVRCYLRTDAGLWLERTVAVATPAADATGTYTAEISLEPAGTWALRAEATATAGGDPLPEPAFSATSTEIRVSAREDTTVWNRDGILTIPERMAYREDARQMIVVTARGLRSTTGTMRVYEYHDGDWVKLFGSPCRLGRSGLMAGEKRRRGNGTTPTGIWLMPDFVFGQHRNAYPGTRLQFRHITKYHWWSSEKGAHYNSWVWSRRRVDGEHLIDYTVAYEYALSTGYNAKPNRSVFGRGAGIFLHVWQGPTTSGCVSVPREVMRRVFTTMDPSVRRVFAVGTTRQGGATDIERY